MLRLCNSLHNDDSQPLLNNDRGSSSSHTQLPTSLHSTLLYSAWRRLLIAQRLLEENVGGMWEILCLGSLGGEYGLLGIGGAGGEISPPKLVTALGGELTDDASIVELTWKLEEFDRDGCSKVPHTHYLEAMQ